MPDPWNDQFRKDDDLNPDLIGEFESDRRRRAKLWIAAAVLVFGVGLAFFFVFGGGDSDVTEEPVVSEAPPTPELPPAPAEPFGAEIVPLDLPPLDETDPVVRGLVGELSSHPQVVAWLATDGLIRNFTVVSSNIAEGKSPAINLRRFRPSDEFLVSERGEDLFMDPKGYLRYNPLVGALTSIDPDGAARLYRSLKPRIDDAYAELGFPDTTFDTTLERAIVLLLRTPIPGDPIALEPEGGTGYRYADSTLESLTPAQRHLLRMGPQNARTVQTALRDLALALGIPPSRLPAPGGR